MLGLERLYYELDSARKRVIRLIEMERVDEVWGLNTMVRIFDLREDVGKKIDELGRGEDGNSS